MADTLFRDGNNNLGQLKTLTATDGSTLPQSAPSDQTGNPFGAANPLPVSVSGVAQVNMNGLGPLPVNVSVSVVPANPNECPDYPLSVGGAGLGFKLDSLLVEIRLLTMIFAAQCGISDLDNLRNNIVESQEFGNDSKSSQGSYTN